MIKRLLRPMFNTAGSWYYRARAKAPVLRFINRDASRRYRARPDPLNTYEQGILSELQANGIASASAVDLIGHEQFSELSHYAMQRWQSPEVQKEVETHRTVLSGEREKSGMKKAFLVNLWEGEAIIDLNHPYIQFSLSAPVLKIVNAYLEQYSKFRAWRFEATIPMPEGVRAQSSQRWHRDEEDIKLVKVFLYLNDVDKETGPFTYLAGSQPGGRWAKIAPHRFAKNSFRTSR